MIQNKKALVAYLDKNHYDIIVVEGYDGVGKGTLLNFLSEYLKRTPYRPDYNLWKKHGIAREDRWRMSAYFLDIWSHFKLHQLYLRPLLFDRGVLSGAVYNNDYNIVKTYKEIIKDSKVLHILVTCTATDYEKFLDIRGITDPKKIESHLENFEEYTKRYKDYLISSGLDYIVFQNKFDIQTAENSDATCIGCGHWNHGWCRHPVMNCVMPADNPRCTLSLDEETQDEYDSEMQCV